MNKSDFVVNNQICRRNILYYNELNGSCGCTGTSRKCMSPSSPDQNKNVDRDIEKKEYMNIEETNEIDGTFVSV